MADLILSGSTSGTVTVSAPAVAGSGTLTLPVATDTLVGKATTDTLTNKSIVATQLTGTIVAARLPTGSTAQIVTSTSGTLATGTTIIPFDNTIPQNTEGDQYLSLAITPQNASSTLEINVVLIVSGTAWSSAGGIVALFQDATANALAAVADGLTNNLAHSISFTHFMAAGTTSATTFKVRAGCGGAGTTTVNGQSGAQLMGGLSASRITIKEYLP